MADKMSQLRSRNCPEEEYPPRPLPIPTDYIETLQSILVKGIRGILPPTFKMILDKYYPLSVPQAPVHPHQQKITPCLPSPMPCTTPDSSMNDQTKSSSFGAQVDGRKEEQLETSLEVEPDDMTGKHRDEENNPLKRQQASEEKDNVFAGGTSHVDQMGVCFFQAEIGKHRQTSQVTARQFVRLPIDRQQRKLIARSTERGGDYPIQADVGRNPRTTTVRVAALEEAAIGGCQRGTTSTEQNNQFDPGGSRVICSFLPSGYLVCCMLFVHALFLFSASFSCYHARFKRLQVFSTEGGSDRDRRTRWMRSSVRAGHGSYRSLIQKGTVVYCCSYIGLIIGERLFGI